MRQQNNLNAIRLLASIAVLVSHSFLFCYGSVSFDPLFHLSRGQTAIGFISVMSFFAISGYLITASFKRHDRVGFVISRLVRLLPALAVVLLITTFLVGPALSTLSLVDYFGSRMTYRFLVGNITLVFPFFDRLPGVFVDNPFPRSVNGSLWTLQYEAACYLAVFILGTASLLKVWPVAGALVAAILAAHFHVGTVVADLVIPFATGALIRVGNIPRNSIAALACLAASALSLCFGGFGIIGGTLGTYAILTFGLAPSRWLPDPKNSIGDLSYGTYVWGFPIEQTLTQMLGAHANWWLLTLCALPPTLIMAALSWHLVEAPTERLKARLRARCPEASPTAPQTV